MNAIVGRTRAVTIAICVAAACATAVAQQTAPGARRNPYAIPGCHMTFLLGTTALAIDADWLDYSVTPQQFGKQECPSRPVERESVYFHRSVLDLLNIGGTLGDRDWLLEIRAAPSFKNEPPTFPAPANRVRGQAVQSSIEMRKPLADAPEILRKFSSRDYEIRYLTSDETMAGRAEITCNGDEVKRVCTGPGARFAGLLVDYRVSQDQFPAPDEISTDPSTELGIMLQFDQRLREWLIDLEHPR